MMFLLSNYNGELGTMLIKVKPFKHECPGSLILRATEANGWDNPNKMIIDISLYSNRDYATAFKSKSHWKEISKQILPDRLKKKKVSRGMFKKRPKSGFSDICFRNIYLAHNAISPENPKICPKCIKEKGYLNDSWNLSFLYQCPIHNIELITKCPHCQTNIRWSRQSIKICHFCKQSLIDTKIKNTNREISKFLNSVIQKQDRLRLWRLNYLYHSLILIYNSLEINTVNYKLTESACLFDINQNAFVSSMCNIYNKATNRHFIHPKIVLLPFLKIEDEGVKKITNDILDLIQSKNSKIFNSRSNTAYDLSQFKNHSYTIAECEIILGVGRSTVKKLIEISLLNVVIHNEKQNRITFSSLNKLLFQLSKGRPPKEREVTLGKILSNPKRLKAGEILKKIIDGEFRSSRMIFSKGIKSVAVTKTNYINQIQLDKNVTLRGNINLRNAANLIGCSYNYLQPLAKKGFIQTERGKYNAYYMKRKSVYEFKRKYFFISQITLKYQLNHTNLAEKLMHLGCKPVSGPTIDGTLVYLFKREDLKLIKKNDLKNLKHYNTNTGRRKDGTEDPIRNNVLISKVSKELGISNQKVLSLIKTNILKPSPQNRYRKYVTEKSYQDLVSILNDEKLIDLKKVFVSLNTDSTYFLDHWVNTRFVKLIDVKLKKFISKKDLNKIKRFQAKFATSKEVSAILNVKRSTCNNLIRLGHLKPDKTLKSTKHKKIYFYDRSKIPEIRKLL